MSRLRSWIVKASNKSSHSTEDVDKDHEANFQPPNDYAPFRRSSSFLRRSINERGYCALQKKKRAPTTNSYYINYVRDPFTTLIDCRWRWMFLLYTLSFIITWYLFGLLWWFIAYAHGDLSEDPYAISDEGIEPCVTFVHDFTSAFLFSMETQYTTGYGTRAPTTECPEAICLLCIQSILGILLQSIMVGAVFAKLSRPKTRGESVMFSKKAVISLRNGQLCLMFRLGDERKSYVVGCKLHAWIIQRKVTEEGEIIPYYLTKLNVSVDDGGSHFFLLWPVTVIHQIDSKSPLYGKTSKDIEDSEMEIVLSLLCTAETTGQQTEKRCSYTPRDIIWGHRFQTVIGGENTDGVVDYMKFDCTEEVGISNGNTVVFDDESLKDSSHDFNNKSN